MTTSPLLAELLPPNVAAVEAFGNATSDIDLFPEEEAAVARAVEKRRREFTTVRACAREALGRLGIPPAPIVPGLRGAPGWPAGVVGSMTHCDGYCASAVALERDVLTIGLDAEPDAALPDGVLDLIALDTERAAVARLAATSPGVSWDRLLFCAKESVYKAWFPLTAEWLGFDQARIEFAPATGEFTATLLVPGPRAGGGQLRGFTGRWLRRRGLLVTAIAVAAGSGLTPAGS